MRLLLAAAVLLLASTSTAKVLPGTLVEYFVDKDAITDENTSTLFVRELNDTGGNNVVMFKCEQGHPEFYLLNKSNLLTQEDYDASVLPQVIYRVDSQAPKTLPTSSVTSDGTPKLTALSLAGNTDATMFTAFSNAQSKVILRVLRKGMKELTFTFPTKGFNQAVKIIGNCQ